jgi:hypothetical protein
MVLAHFIKGGGERSERGICFCFGLNELDARINVSNERSYAFHPIRLYLQLNLSHKRVAHE